MSSVLGSATFVPSSGNSGGYAMVGGSCQPPLPKLPHQQDPGEATKLALGKLPQELASNQNGVPKLALRPDATNILMCKQWWKACWVHGDQYKHYRQLYSKKTKISTLLTKPKKCSSCSESDQLAG